MAKACVSSIKTASRQIYLNHIHKQVPNSVSSCSPSSAPSASQDSQCVDSPQKLRRVEVDSPEARDPQSVRDANELLLNSRPQASDEQSCGAFVGPLSLQSGISRTACAPVGFASDTDWRSMDAARFLLHSFSSAIHIPTLYGKSDISRSVLLPRSPKTKT